MLSLKVQFEDQSLGLIYT